MSHNHPEVPTFKIPEQPPFTPQDLVGNTNNTIVRLATTVNDVLRYDWAVLKGFIKGILANIRDTLDLKYYEDLEHVEHCCKYILPSDYIINLEQEHCPCDEQAVKECREHYFRGWQRNTGPKT